MQVPAQRIPVILLGAVAISLLLGSTAVARQTQATPTSAVAILVSLTPTDTPPPTDTVTPTLEPSPTEAPSRTPRPSPTRTPVPSATFTPGPTPDAKARTREVRVPILMYHHVGPLPNGPDNIRIGLTVLPDRFEAQVKFLQSRGYESIDMYQMYAAITTGAALPPKPIIFTFDDAYDDVYDFAFPIMKKYGYTGTVFVPTEFIDLGRAGYLTWEQLEELHAAGWRLEPHTKTHEEVDNRSREWLIYQMLGSMETLRFHLGYQPRFFAYPSGSYDDKAIEVLQEIGYWGAVTTDSSWFHRLSTAYTWGRVRVAGQFVMKDFASVMGEKYP